MSGQNRVTAVNQTLTQVCLLLGASELQVLPAVHVVEEPQIVESVSDDDDE